MEAVLSDTPYPGLASFSRHQYDIFFGRDDHIDAMLEKLSESHFLCVTGPSGCGKSSLARTGLFNALESGFLHGYGSDWVICDFSPGNEPISRLVCGLARGIVLGDAMNELDAKQQTEVDELAAYFHSSIENASSNLNLAADKMSTLKDRPVAILVDQFEELFRFAQRDRHEAARFVDVLLKTAKAAGRIFVIITVRTEELSRCARYPGLTEAINQSQFLTPTLDRFQLQEAIEGPIRLFGGEVEPLLTVRILNDLEREMDKLPLMQHALRLLYSKKKQADPDKAPIIGLDDFTAEFNISSRISIGEPRSALREAMSYRLDAIYRDLPKDLKRVTARAFCALTNVSSQGRDIRNALDLHELAEIINEPVDKTVALVRRFAEGETGYLRCDGKLDGTDNPKIDVTHECVLRLWRRLQERWLPKELKNGQFLKEIARRTQRRKELLNKPGGWRARLMGDGLFRGAELKRYAGWWNDRSSRPNGAWARRYLDEVNTETGRVSSKGSLPVTFAGTLDFMNKSMNAANRRTWVAAAATVSLIGFGAYSFNEDLKDERTKVALELRSTHARLELEEQRKDAAEQKNRANVANAVAALNPSELDQNPVETIALGIGVINSARAASVGEDTMTLAKNKLWLANFHTFERQRLQLGSGRDGDVYAADFARDGEQIITWTHVPELSIWSMSNSSKPDTVISLADSLTKPERKAGRSMRVAPDGHTVAVGTWRGAVAMVDLNTGSVLELYAGPDPDASASVLDVSFSTDGNTLAAGSLDGTVRVWGNSAQDGLEGWKLHTEIRHQAPVYSVGLNDDGTLLGVGLENGMVCLSAIKISGSDRVCDGNGHVSGQAVKAISFRPGGEYFVSAGNDDTAVMWAYRPTPGNALGFVPVELGPRIWFDSDVWDVNFDQLGTYMAVIVWDGAIKVFDAENWKPLSTFRGHTPPTRTVRFDPTGQYLVSAGHDNTARIWSPFASLGTDEKFSFRFESSNPDRRHRAIRNLAFGPNAGWIAFTDRNDVYIKSAEGPVQLLEVPRNFDGIVPEIIDLAVGEMSGHIAASLVTPQVQLWKPTGDEGQLQSITLDLSVDEFDDDLSRRPVAVHPEGSAVAVAVLDSTGNTNSFGFRICALSADGLQPSCGAPIVIKQVNPELLPDQCANEPPRLNELAFSKDGKLLAAAGQDCVVRLFEIDGENSKFKGLVTGHVGSITSLHFSTDNEKLITGASDWSGRIENLKTGKVVQLLGPHRSALTGVRLSPAGQTAVTVSVDERLIVWDMEDGKPLSVMPGHSSSIFALDIAKDQNGRVLIATGSQNGELQVIPYFEKVSALQEFSRGTLLKVVGQEALDALVDGPNNDLAQ
ncbi:AAA family ATPase [Aliiroseovarius sp. F20344]|uniref:AAA family ATPase n=1 Tax=Aliiroseovarius sp. F20344 TaxID=2926414 RepID=UPI001FF63030|nr:AAA family ATPase [Aliiroseovarius sp. F20344]MCK0143010.1 AAA family ATPase [Aliiroseovarius sp. F20344]